MSYNFLAQSVGPEEMSLVLIIVVVCVIAILPAIFYLLTLQKALSRCSEENREMAPGMVWLLFIPLFNLFWHFMIVIKMAATLEKEFQARGIQSDPLPGKSIGMPMCILSVCSIIPVVGGLASLGYLVCWIIYWVKISGYSKQLA